MSLQLDNTMKLSTRNELLKEAEEILSELNNRIHEDKFDPSQLELKLKRLYQKAKDFKRMNEKEESDSIEIKDPIDRTPWRKRSKWAIKNLPPTNDPTELKIRENMRKWQMLNDKIIDSWLDYASARGGESDDIDIVVKKVSVFTDHVYDARTLKPVPSIKNPNKVMEYGEWRDIVDRRKQEARGTIGGLLYKVLEELGGRVW